MTALLAAAVAWTLADATAYLTLVVPGLASEQNGLVASLTVGAALWARFAVVVLMVALSVVAAQRPVRRLQVGVGVVLATASVVGVVGFASTVAGALA